MADSAVLLAWRNDSETREASRDVEPVSQQEHEAWLASVLADRKRHLLIATGPQGPIGPVRLDPGEGGHYEISVSVAAGVRGIGLGTRLIQSACDWAWRHTGASQIDAWVKRSNTRSLRAFHAAGFDAAAEGQETEEMSHLVSKRPTDR